MSYKSEEFKGTEYITLEVISHFRKLTSQKEDEEYNV